MYKWLTLTKVKARDGSGLETMCNCWVFLGSSSSGCLGHCWIIKYWKVKLETKKKKITTYSMPLCSYTLKLQIQRFPGHFPGMGFSKQCFFSEHVHETLLFFCTTLNKQTNIYIIIIIINLILYSAANHR